MDTNSEHELIPGENEYILDRDWKGNEALTEAVINYLHESFPEIVIIQQKFTFFVNETDEAVTREATVFYYDGDLPAYHIDYLRGLFKGFVEAWNLQIQRAKDSDAAYLGL